MSRAVLVPHLSTTMLLKTEIDVVDIGDVHHDLNCCCRYRGCLICRCYGLKNLTKCVYAYVELLLCRQLTQTEEPGRLCSDRQCYATWYVAKAVVLLQHMLLSLLLMFLLSSCRHVVVVVVVGFLGFLISVVDHVVVVGVVAPASVLGSQVSRRWYSEIKLDFFTASQVRAA